jgi:hypothetical protein
MNFKSKIATLVLAATVAIGAASPAFADNSSTTVVQEITAGTVLKAELLPGSFLNAMPFSQDAQTSKGKLMVKVEDGRGTNEGWQVTLQAQDFAPQGINGAQPIPAKGFNFVNGDSLAAAKGSSNGIQTGTQNVSLGETKTVLKANSGNGTGVYTQGLNVTLDIPAGQLVGKYQSNVTVNITSGPGN